MFFTDIDVKLTIKIAPKANKAVGMVHVNSVILNHDMTQRPVRFVMPRAAVTKSMARPQT